jgi:predicted O-methyltransferase YrrM
LRPFSETEAASWYDGIDFSVDWTSWHFPNWAKLLKRYRSRTVRVLEIGSWEGRSALFFLNYLPKSRVTCVDTFAGGQEHRQDAARNAEDARFLRSVQRRFDRNTRPLKRRVEKMVMQSTEALAELALKQRRYDIAYIDGGHRAVEVYTDAMLTWPLIARGGTVMFDDYEWKDMPHRLDRPKAGIDTFLRSIKGEYRLVHKEYQVAIVKR